MNLRGASSDGLLNIANHVEFNDTGRYFVAAIEDGFKVFEADTCELHGEQHLTWSPDSATILGDTQITGLVMNTHESTKLTAKLVLWDSRSKKQAATVQTKSAIIRCRLSQVHIALVFRRNVNLYRHQPRIERIASYETSDNARGLCCLGKEYLVIPGRTAGHLQIIKLRDLEVSIVPAHTSAVKAIAVNRDEEVIATASQQGTLIRLHSPRTCARMGELRRGVNPATIYSLAISPSGAHLAVTSDTNTLHIFNLPGSSKSSKSSSTVDGNWQRLEHTPSPPPPGNYMNLQKWGGLAKLPFAPRVFSDVYSFASAHFDPGEEKDKMNVSSKDGYVKGVVGWVEDQVLAVISAGKDARYERFELMPDDTGKTVCSRVGWSRFLRPS
ncbi:MAG: Phosphatidylinositol 3,5-bisphosphate-binding protein [Chrysothrix sp. TS-e1954]|nr:MAG: Phosphatidylinositol 3,5-bisphosphate-binding protein [Chrysothrix sp. TS-e1954]